MRKDQKLYFFIPLNLMAVGLFFYFFISVGGFDGKIMFSTVDAKTYFAVSQWISQDTATHALEFRPILYPLFLFLLSKVAGSYGIFLFQSVLWLAMVNLIGYSLLKVSKKLIWSFFGGGLLMSNFSLIALTGHALTEVSTTFFLALFVTFCVKYKHKYNQLFFLHGCLFLMAMLTIIKPVFLIPFYIILILIICFHTAKYFRGPTNFIWLVLAMMPVIIQSAILKSEYGEFQISNVGTLAFQEYLFPQGIQHIDRVSREDALEISSSLSQSERLNYVMSKPKVYFDLFFENIHDNVKASAPFLNESNAPGNNGFPRYMVFMNTIYYKFHLTFLPITVFMLFLFIKHKKFQDLILASGLYLLGFYLIFVTGISFWQGDRLVLPTIAIWTFLYPYLGFQAFKLFKSFLLLNNSNKVLR